MTGVARGTRIVQIGWDKTTVEAFDGGPGLGVSGATVVDGGAVVAGKVLGTSVEGGVVEVAAVVVDGAVVGPAVVRNAVEDGAAEVDSAVVVLGSDRLADFDGV